MRIYLSGRISGTEDYLERFEKAERKLKSRGWTCDVINPARICSMLPRDMSHSEYMLVCIAMLSVCDAIYIIDPHDVETSNGVKEECIYALSHKMQIIYGDGEDS